jgi:NADH-quinone oxidoreductase subunit D
MASKAFKEIDLNMGPQHPSTHGVLRLKVSIDNEVVLHLEPVLGYLHRGMEKLWESQSYPQIVPLTDRLDYLAPLSNELGYCLAVEKLAGIEVPKRAQYIRVILVELQRIASHLAAVAFQANDVGAMSVLLYGFERRESILDIFETYAGGRMTIHGLRIGGVRFDLDEPVIGMVRKVLEAVPKTMADIDGLLTNNRIWRHRTEGIGLISQADALDTGLTGPCLRAAGMAWDIRRDLPYSSYEDFDFDVPVRTESDVLARYLVRMEEMRQSLRIIRQALDALPAGDHIAKVRRTLRIPPGEIFHSIEAPKGELGFYIKSNGTDKPERIKMKSPSFINLQSFEGMCQGNLFADIVGILGSLDIVLGEIDK